MNIYIWRHNKTYHSRSMLNLALMLMQLALAIAIITSVNVCKANTSASNENLTFHKTVLKNAKRPDYNKHEGWAYQEISMREEKPADVFYIPSTTDLKGQNGYNLDLSDSERIKYYCYTVTKETSLYKKSCAIFSPYYRQVTFPAYQLPESEREKHLKFAYKDVRRAFSYYLKKRPQQRPFILAGYSQGADMIERLLLDRRFSHKKQIKKNLVAAYAIGWGITEDRVIKSKSETFIPAKKADDIGVTIVFNTEAPEVAESIMVPKNMKSICINPFNWRTDDTYASASENLGAKLVNRFGEVKRELGPITGGYIDLKRGVVKLTDIKATDFNCYPFPEGVYHMYDYQFTFSNLENNVETRIKAYLKKCS